MRIHAGIYRGLVLALSLALVPVASFSAQKVTSGSRCSVHKQKVIHQSKTFTCVKSGTKLVWSKGVALKRPQATPTPSPTASPTSSPTASPTPSPTRPMLSLSGLTDYLDVNKCKLINGSGEVGVNQSFDLSPYRVRTTKTVRALIFPIDFPDLIGNTDPQKDFAYVAAGVSDFFKQMSEGRLTMSWTIHPSFIRYSTRVSDANLGGRTTTGYGAFAAGALELAKQTVDISSYDLVVYAPPLTTTRAQIAIGPAFIASGPGQINATMLDGQSYESKSAKFPYTTAHEVGHLMGLADLYNYDAANDAAASPGTQTAFELQFKYMGVFDLMNWAGGAGVELTAWNRWIIDLISDEQMRCLPTTSTTTWLSPLGVFGGIKGAVIPISSTTAIVIESRRALRFDKDLPKSAEGVLVYKVDTSVRSGQGPIRVLGRSGSTDMWYRDAPLKLSDALTVDGYTIQVVESADFGDVVRVIKN